MSNRNFRNRQRRFCQQVVEHHASLAQREQYGPQMPAGVVVVIARVDKQRIVARDCATGYSLGEFFKSAAAAQRAAFTRGFRYVTGSAAKEKHTVRRIRLQFQTAS